MMNAPQHRQCPDDEVLRELAAGIGSPELAEQAVQHASHCRLCGPALKRYLREFSTEEKPENAPILEQLKSSRAEWRRQLVREQTPRRRAPWMKLVPAFAALAIAVLAFLAGPSLLTEYKIRQAEKQAAAAFADRRTTEMRLSAVDYSPYKPFPIVLGSESGRSLDELPPSLHDASSAANENLKSAHPDPRWLQVQGRALLWEATPGSIEKAEKNFERARAEGLNTASLKIDLAASYFERDSKSENPRLQRTLDLLNEVVSSPELSSQDRASALYNLAIAYEKIEAWDMAVSTWEKYLQADPSSAWAAEAARRLKDARARLPAASSRNYGSPGSFLDQLSRRDFQPEDLEQYQQEALARWLPVALQDPNNESHRALAALAGVLAEKNSDPWLKEFMAALPAGDNSGAATLSAVVLANENGFYGPASGQGRAAAELFARQGNLPGKLFAQFQEVYGMRSLVQGEKCLARADALWDELARTNYGWLKGQVALERAQCRNFHGDLAESDSDSKASLSMAERFHFPVLGLRVYGISASMQSQQGRCDTAWEHGIQGLKRYWQGAYPRDRLDQFYSVMWQCTEEAGSLYAAEALLQHTIAMREVAGSRNLFREAMLHLRLRNMLLAQKQYGPAAVEEARASALLDKIKGPVDSTEYRLINDIEPTELQLRQGDPQRALATITRVGETLKTIQSGLIRLNYDRVLGSIYLELKRFAEADAAYLAAIDIAEDALQTLNENKERLQWLKATDDCYRGLVRVLLEQKKEKEALQRWEWYQSRPWVLGFHSGAPLEERKLKAPRPQAQDGAAHVVYASFRDGLQIWVSSNKGVQGAWVAVKQQDFERVVRDFSERCSTPDSNLSEVREQGSWLYARLLQPVIAQLPESGPVVVELDRSSYNLAVEALPSPAGWYFGEKYPVVYSPGAEMEQALRAPAQLDARTAIFLLDASHSPGAGYLPGMEAQRSVIARLFPRTKIVDSASTTWSQIKPRLESSQVFHYIGHGRQDGSGTTLVFNVNQSLRARDIAPGLFAHSQLVVLAACSTALGRENGLLDTNSLVRAFLMARVPRVVASHWDVDSATTSRLMASFYSNIAAGKSIAQAIFEARKEVLLSHPHPYYWASFSVTGRVS